MIDFKFFIRFITLFFIFTALSLTAVHSVNDKDKEVKDKTKDEKIKDKDEKVKDKDIKDKIKDSLDDSKSEKDIKSSDNLKSSMPDTSAKLEKNILSLEEIQAITEKIKKDIKQQGGNSDDIKNSFSVIKNGIILIKNEKDAIIIRLNKKQQENVKEQNDSINDSVNNLGRIFDDFNNGKQLKDQKLFDMTLEIEKEIKIIYRQFRAIDWILSEK